VQPKLAADQQNLHLVWAEQAYDEGGFFSYQVFYAELLAGSSLWSTPARVNLRLQDPDTGESFNAAYVQPDLAVTGDKAAVVWRAGNPYTLIDSPGDIYLRRQVDSFTWEDEPTLISENDGQAAWPRIAAEENGVLHVIWSTNGEIHYRQGSISGQDWSDIETVPGAVGVHPVTPNIAVDSAGQVYVSYVAANGDAAIATRNLLGAWSTQVVVVGFDGLNTAVVLDNTATPHLIVQKTTSLFEMTGGQERVLKHYYAGGQHIATRIDDGVDDELYYILSDHLGSTSVVADAQGDKVGHVVYDPFGEILESTVPLTITDRLFTGYRWDGTIGLYDANARFYDPALGQFTQPDSLVPQPYNPIAWNRYAYVYNSPLC
jgi:RHS repeat-associated protein